jgi:hypothetical protein
MEKFDSKFYIVVKHSYSEAPRYTWEIHSIEKVLSVGESPGRFDSWEEASIAGKTALADYVGN